MCRLLLPLITQALTAVEEVSQRKGATDGASNESRSSR